MLDDGTERTGRLQGRVLVPADARSTLNPAEVPGLDRAKLNVWELAHEILERLKSEQGRGQQEEQTTNMAGAA